ncbi:MAG: hypothetical protein VX663_05085, partial [Pseudomonadota bacterium]|nr:hypothetical protein [Pseudomonadota bacterium]
PSACRGLRRHPSLSNAGCGRSWSSGDGPGGGAAVLGDVQMIHVREGLVDPGSGRFDPGDLEPIGRLGGDWYARVTDRFELPRYRPTHDAGRDV